MEALRGVKRVFAVLKSIQFISRLSNLLHRPNRNNKNKCYAPELPGIGGGQFSVIVRQYSLIADICNRKKINDAF